MERKKRETSNIRAATTFPNLSSLAFVDFQSFIAAERVEI